MCGIAGISWTSSTASLTKDDVMRMTSVLEHRGPDDFGIYDSRSSNAASNPEVGAILGQRRLSIIDLAGGHQPLSNEDGTIWITFNGEIYNYRELRSQLESQGHRFQTSSDTETIVHLYEEYGTSAVEHLRGMFSLAIWDEPKKQLFFARDRLGQKPLFYRQESGRLLFASELKALLQVPGAQRELDPFAVDQYLTYQYVPYPGCILKGYNKLPPAHWAVYRDGQLQIERYWSPPFSSESLDDRCTNPKTKVPQTPGEWKAELRRTLTEAVRLRMRSDVPLGAFLSGGIDSSIIAGLMQELSETPIHTFSIGFPVKKFDESAYARTAAEHLRTEHHEAIVEPAALEILPRLIWHYDEPFSDSSAIPTMYLSEMTRQTVKVALSGDGGDELFAGYDRYRAVRLAAKLDRLPGPIRKLLSANIWQKIPASVEQKSFRRKVKRFLEALGKSPEERYLEWVGIFNAKRRKELYTDDFREKLDGADAADFLRTAYAECPDRDFVTRTTCADLLTYLPCDILTKVDIASMAYSLECRSPFLDHHVTELAARMPLSLKLQGRKAKRILVETFADLLPPSIQNRSKMGFGVPLDDWFRNELKPLLYDTLLDSTAKQRGYFQTAIVEKLVDEHVSAQWDHSYRLWSLLCFESWHRMFLDSTTPPVVNP